jgi:hypothetical protein
MQVGTGIWSGETASRFRGKTYTSKAHGRPLATEVSSSHHARRAMHYSATSGLEIHRSSRKVHVPLLCAVSFKTPTIDRCFQKARWAPIKGKWCKVFFWLLTHNRLNTRALLITEEKIHAWGLLLCDEWSSAAWVQDHLFFQCPFAILYMLAISMSIVDSISSRASGFPGYHDQSQINNW